MKSTQLVKGFFKDNGRYYAGAVLCNWATSAVGFVSPLIISFTVDFILGDQPTQISQALSGWVDTIGGRQMLLQNIWICSIAIILLALINAVFSFFSGRFTAVASESIARSMRNQLYHRLQNADYEYHVQVETGDLIQRCTSDVETIRRFFAGQVVELARTVFMLVVSISLMLSIDYRMTLVSLAMFPVLIFGSAIYFKKVHERFKAADEAEGKMSTVLQENLAGMRVVRAFGRQAYEVDKFEKENSNYAKLAYSVSKSMAVFWGATDALSYLQMAAVLSVGVILCVNDQLTIGNLIVFNSYVGMLLWPMRQMGRILADMGRAKVSLGRVTEILSVPLEGEKENGTKPDLHGDIVLENVSFTYPNGHEVLKNVSLTIPYGKTLAILGGTGSGKSTLVHLLQRLYDVTEGTITINGHDIRTLDRKWLRGHIGIVLQEPFLYSRTVKANIAITNTQADDETIFESSEIASLHGVIVDFENGYDTVVGERGVTLSGGQKQRVAIARLLMQKTPVLIFDDSLSAVDTQTDMQIRARLKESRKNATSIIIAHRVTTLAEADYIIVLEDGCLVQQGTHEELIAQPGLYDRIWTIQSMAGDDFDRPEETGGETA